MEINKDITTNIKLIATDLDGTLLLPDKTLSAANKAALTWAAEEKGIYIAIATGRPYFGIRKLLEWLPCIRYAVLSNGAVVQDTWTGEIIAKQLMKTEDALAFYDYAVSQNLIVDFFDQGERFVPPNWKEAVALMEASEGTKQLLISNCTITKDQRARLAAAQGIEKISVRFRNGAQRNQFYSKFQEKFPQLKVSTSLATNIETTDQGITKETGLKNLASYLGLQMDEIMVFGDNENDREMIQAAGIGVVMGNASDEMKQIADKITRNNTEDGVAYMVQEVLRWQQELL